MSDPFDRLAESRDEADRVAQRLESTRDALTEVSGSDETGEVSVRLSPEGEVLDLVIGNRWSASIEPEALGAAVLQAYAAAAQAAAEQWGTALAEAGDAPDPAVRPAPPAYESTYARLDEITRPDELAGRSREVLEAMVGLLREMNEQFDGVLEQATSVAEGRHTGASSGLTVTVSGAGVLQTVEVRAEWAARTNGPALAQHFTKAYREALRQARARTADDVVGGSVFGEMQRLAQDPDALARRLRMT